MSQVWMTNSLGGFLSNVKLSKTIRHAASPLYAFRQFVKAKEQPSGTRRGDTVTFDKLSRINTRGTATLVETATVPEAGYTITQGSVVVKEYGQAIPYTGKLEDLSEFNVNNETTIILRDDQADSLDRAAATEFMSAKFIAVCTSTSSTVFTTNGTATVTAGANMSDKNVRDVIDEMKKKKIPKYGNGKDYVCLASVNSERGLYDYLQAIMQYTTPEFMYNSENGRYYNCRFAEENNVLSNTVGSDSQYGEAVFFGNDAVIENVVIPEEIRMKIPTDYGRDKGVMWYYIGGFKKIWDYASDVEEHIIYLTSA